MHAADNSRVGQRINMHATDRKIGDNGLSEGNMCFGGLSEGTNGRRCVDSEQRCVDSGME